MERDNNTQIKKSVTSNETIYGGGGGNCVCSKRGKKEGLRDGGGGVRGDGSPERVPRRLGRT